jgi:hypothetical protein
VESLLLESLLYDVGFGRLSEKRLRNSTDGCDRSMEWIVIKGETAVTHVHSSKEKRISFEKGSEMSSHPKSRRALLISRV